jgi:hypothetical protein
MSGGRKTKKDIVALDELIEEILVDAYGDDEQYSAFQAVLEDAVELPSEGRVIGEPVSLVAWEYDGNERCGVNARCRRKNGTEYIVSAWEVELPETAEGARYLAAYRRWLGLEPFSKAQRTTGKKAGKKTSVKSSMKVAETAQIGSVNPIGPIELAVIALKERALRCRLLGSLRQFTLRQSGLVEAVPGEVITVHPKKRWTYGGHEYMSGEITAMRLDIKALGLVPLELRDNGIWDPNDQDWGEEGPSTDEWMKMLPINARGRRHEYEMEQVLPGTKPDDDSDPIIESSELKASGDMAGARKMLMDLCQADLRCLDAHAHLGLLVFENWPAEAIRHYEVGMRIGELSLGEGFEEVLPWILIDNRPFLRCMQGYGLCLWRLERFDEAGRVFNRMLLLNPSDNQGVRFLIDQVAAKRPWSEDSD